jgi:hypothetical protein
VHGSLNLDFPDTNSFLLTSHIRLFGSVGEVAFSSLRNIPLLWMAFPAGRWKMNSSVNFRGMFLDGSRSGTGISFTVGLLRFEWVHHSTAFNRPEVCAAELYVFCEYSL